MMRPRDDLSLSEGFKRGRGRPPGSGKRQLLTTLGECLRSPPEGISRRMLSPLLQERAASSGSFTMIENGGVRNRRTGGIIVSLAGPDGRVVGGGIAGLLLAAAPIQVVVGSFLPNTLKEAVKRKVYPEP